MASRELEGKAVGVDDHGGVIAGVARGVGGHEHGKVAKVTGAAYRKDTVILDQELKIITSERVIAPPPLGGRRLGRW